jgi:putative PIN family toxin of toxin-antitoxin system
MPNQVERVVFDCVIYAQALMSDTGPSFACLELARARKIELVWSFRTLEEIRELPEKLPKKFKIDTVRIEAFLHDVSIFAELIDPISENYINPLDIDDSHYVNLAVSASAKLITSWDDHLRMLMDRTKPSGKEFRDRFPDLLILTPVELLTRIRSV